jgi:hypothetical protein
VKSSVVLQLDTRPDAGPVGALDTFLLDPFLEGSLPHECRRTLPSSPPLEVLLPDGAEVLRTTREDDDHRWVIEGEGWRALLRSTEHWGATVDVFATTAELAERVAAEVHDRCPAIEEPESVSITIWHSSNKPVSRGRSLSCTPWERSRRNYPFAVRGALDQLVALRPVGDGGRVLLLHGEPGTGKTSAIRTLLWEWRSWADPQLVLDGDAFVRDAAYMTEVAARDVDDDRWNVIVLEDAADLVDDDNPFGGDLSRLLNASDGIVGHGARALFLLTTNEAVSSLHPALVRPGRCLANVEFPRFTRCEALEWLGDPNQDVPYGGLALADLYDRDREVPLITNVRAPEPAGLYL